MAMKQMHGKSPVDRGTRTFYKFVGVEAAKKILANGTLRWSSPLNFNDPLDVWRELGFGFDLESLRDPLAHEFRRVLQDKDVSISGGHPMYVEAVRRLRKPDAESIRVLPNGLAIRRPEPGEAVVRKGQ